MTPKMAISDQIECLSDCQSVLESIGLCLDDLTEEQVQKISTFLENKKLNNNSFKNSSDLER